MDPVSASPVDERERRLAMLLHRAGELLRTEQVAAAEREVMQALALRPDDVRAQNLLGLVHFRSGRFEDALALYRDLTARSPDDPALRLNLGLVELRMGRHADAAANLSRVVEKEPENQKAHGYLALAYQRSGDIARAARAYRAAGQEDKAQQLEASSGAVPSRARSNGVGAMPFNFDLLGDERFSTAPADVAPLKWTPPLTVSEFATRRLVSQSAAGEPFGLTETGMLVVRIDGRLPTRTAGAICSVGNLNYEPMYRRERGAATKETFGEDIEAITVATGNGMIVVAARDLRFTILALDSDILYLREPSVFAFEESLSWENGRIPGGAGASPHIVQFRGVGRIVLRTRRPMATVKVDPDNTMFVEEAALVGWIGRVVPRQLRAEDGQLAPYLEVSGEGALILEEPPNTPAPPTT